MKDAHRRRRMPSGTLPEAPGLGPVGPSAAQSAPAAGEGAALMRRHARRQAHRVRREQLTLRTAGPARVRSFDVHPAVR